MERHIIYLSESSKKYRNEDDARKEQKMITNLGGKIYSCSGRMYKEGVYGVFDQKPPYLETSEIGDVQFNDFEEVGEDFKWKKLRRKIEDTIRKEASPENLVFWAKILRVDTPKVEVRYDPYYTIRASESLPTNTLESKSRSYTLSPEDKIGNVQDIPNIIRILKKIILQMQ